MIPSPSDSLTDESLSLCVRRYVGVTCHFLTSDWQMHSALLACLPLTGGSSGNRVLSDFDEVCHSHGVSGRAFRVVADYFLAAATTTAAKPCCLPGFLVEPSLANGQNEEGGEEVDNGTNVEGGIRNGDGREEEEWEDLWAQGLGVCRVDCFSRSLEQCVREGLRSCPQITATLSKAACFYNYITSAVPPEKLSQVFDGPGLSTRAPGNSPPVARDWAAQLKVCAVQTQGFTLSTTQHMRTCALIGHCWFLMHVNYFIKFFVLLIQYARERLLSSVTSVRVCP